MSEQHHNYPAPNGYGNSAQGGYLPNNGQQPQPGFPGNSSGAGYQPAAPGMPYSSAHQYALPGYGYFAQPPRRKANVARNWPLMISAVGGLLMFISVLLPVYSVGWQYGNVTWFGSASTPAAFTGVLLLLVGLAVATLGTITSFMSKSSLQVTGSILAVAGGFFALGVSGLLLAVASSAADGVGVGVILLLMGSIAMAVGGVISFIIKPTSFPRSVISA